MTTTEVTTAKEHLSWCKDRAMEYVDRGQLDQAWISFVSDMRKHEGTRDHAAINLGATMFMSNMLSTRHEMEKFIKGFN